MSADHLGPQILTRLLAGQSVLGVDPMVLPEPWGDLAGTVLQVEGPARRMEAFKVALRARPDRAAILTAVRAALSPAGAAAAVVRLADVADQAVRWLWPGRLPLGKLTVLDGDPGLGKSALTLDLAARVTTGRPMPDGMPSDLAGPRGAVLLTAEDGLADTVRPRLLAAGADIARIAALTAVADRPTSGRGGYASRRRPTLTDLPAIRQAVAAVDAALVVVDPIMAYLPHGVDGGRETAIRAVLAQLAGLAEEADVAVIVVRHLAKAVRSNPLYRGGGSIGIIGAARSGLLVGRDPADRTGARRVLASTKANLAEASASLAYRLARADNGAVRVVWDGPSDHTAASLLDRPVAERDRDRPTALAEARDVLAAILADGPKTAIAVQAEARTAGVSAITLRRARESLGIRPRKDRYQGAWFWELPGSSSDDAPATLVAAAEPRPTPAADIARARRSSQR